MKLRDYQKSAVEKVLECWRDFKSCLIVLPTGCGKTVVFAEIIRRCLADSQLTGESVSSLVGSGRPTNQPTNQQPTTSNHIYDIDDDDEEEEEESPKKRAMILAHREELITQARDKVRSITGADVQIEMGAFEVKPMFGEMPQVVVSTVQTQCTGRMTKFNPYDYGVLVIDEAHHATAKSYRKCIDHYFQNPDCRLLGVTATPDRADESALGQVFETVAFEYSVTDAIHDGWLVPVKQRLVKVNSLDFSKVTTCAGDFNQGELAQVLEEEHNLHAIAVPTMEICGDRRAIIFAASVRQAERICEIINRGKWEEREGRAAESGEKGQGENVQKKINRAAWVCGKTEKNERRNILDNFKNGKIQFVVNVGVLTEGFDDAGVSVVVMARPTKSRALYAQMAGRATRPAAEVAARLGEVDGCSLMVDGSSQTTNNQELTTNNQPADAAAARRALIAASSKPSCLIIDFVGNSGRHKLVSTADILGGEVDDEDEEEARHIAKTRCEESGSETDMIAEVEKARTEIKAAKEAAAKRRSFIQATARFVEVSIDPFNIFDLPPIEKTSKCTLGTHLSWRQKQLLRDKLKIDPEKLSVESVRQLLDEYFRRVNAKLATFGQVKALRKFGVPVPMTFDEANRTLTKLFKDR